MISGLRAFLTGATGFLGSRVLTALRARGVHVVALDRTGVLRSRLDRERVGTGRVETIAADLSEPARYRDALASADVVMHLAALTGKAPARDHVRVNAEGTEALLDTCRRVGASRMLFVSSIAVKFPDKRGYYYALAKARAEEAVRASQLRFTIVRPTIILGPGSPVLAALGRLAALPVIPVFGDGRTRVQPIDVDDLAEYLLAVLVQDRFHGETLELGGAASLTIEDLLIRIRNILRPDGGGRVVHVPLGLVIPPLRAAESLGLGRVLPVSVGQLSSFRFDGTVQSNPLYESRLGDLRDLQETLSMSLPSTNGRDRH